MNREDLLKNIADAGYNIGFGMKKHFATYDIVSKCPGFIGFLSTAIGIYSLIFESLSDKFVSATVLIVGIIGLYLAVYDDKKDNYAKAGEKQLAAFNKLKTLYYIVKSGDDNHFSEHIVAMEEIIREANTHAISRQIFLSDWYAHYKFFWQHQIEWIDEQKHFKIFRDKIPLTFSLTFIAAVVAVAVIWGPSHIITIKAICG